MLDDNANLSSYLYSLAGPSTNGELANFSASPWNYGYSNAFQLSMRVSLDPIKDLKADLVQWRKASIQLHNTNSIVRTATREFALNVVGSGIQVLIKYQKGTEEQRRKVNAACQKIVQNWQNNAHIDGQQSQASVERSIISTICREGDVLAYLTLTRNGRFAKSPKLRVDLIAGHRIDTPSAGSKITVWETGKNGKAKKTEYPDFDSFTKKTGTDTYLGVVVKSREIVGYLVKNTFDDNFTFFEAFDEFGNIKSVLLKDPSSDTVLNSYRGIPTISQNIDTVDQLDTLLEAEAKASIAKTNMTGVYKVANSQIAANAGKANGNAPGNVGPVTRKVNGIHWFVLQGNDSLELSKGSDISNPNLETTTKTLMTKVSSSYGMPRELLYNDLGESTYSVVMGLRQQGFERGEVWRNYLVSDFFAHVYRLVLIEAISLGLIPGVSEFSEDDFALTFVGRPNHPIKLKEVYEANEIAVRSGQRSLIDIATENGDDALRIAEDSVNLEAYRRTLSEAAQGSRMAAPEDLERFDRISSLVTMLQSGQVTSEGAKTLLITVLGMSAEDAKSIVEGIKIQEVK